MCAHTCTQKLKELIKQIVSVKAVAVKSLDQKYSGVSKNIGILLCSYLQQIDKIS